MKSLHKLNNVDRGRLLADLFPAELPDLIRYIQQEARQLREKEQFIRTHWSATLFTVDFWFSLVENIDRKIQKCGSKIHNNHRWFAGQLFDGYDALFTLYCLQEYATTTACSGQYRQAIHLIFGEARLTLTNQIKP